MTPECSLPHHEQQKTQAMRVLQLSLMTSAGAFLPCLGHCDFIRHHPSQSALADMIFVVLPTPTFCKLALQGKALLAFQASWEPTLVECPRCENSFALSAQDEVLSPDTSVGVMAHERTSK